MAHELSTDDLVRRMERATVQAAAAGGTGLLVRLKAHCGH